MTASRTTTDSFLRAFGELEAHGGAMGPEWLRALRRRAIGRFAERGLPSTRDEEWKYTSLAPLAAIPFDLTPAGAAGDPSEDAVAPFSVGPPSWSRLVFVNGRYVA